MSMFWIILIGLAILLFIAQTRLNPKGTFWPKLFLSSGISLIATIVLFVVFKLIVILFWPAVVACAAVALYLAFVKKKR